jgi:hypothetical protein
MSNRPRFTHTKFSNADGSDISYGYRVSDDEMTTYGDMWDEYQDLDDLSFLRAVVAIGDRVVDDLLAYMQVDKRGAYINNVWYEYNEIEHIVDAVGDDDDDSVDEDV